MSWSDNNNNPWGSQGGGNGRGQGPDMDNVCLLYTSDAADD